MLHGARHAALRAPGEARDAAGLCARFSAAGWRARSRITALAAPPAPTGARRSRACSDRRSISIAVRVPKAARTIHAADGVVSSVVDHHISDCAVRARRGADRARRSRGYAGGSTPSSRSICCASTRLRSSGARPHALCADLVCGQCRRLPVLRRRRSELAHDRLDRGLRGMGIGIFVTMMSRIHHQIAAKHAELEHVRCQIDAARARHARRFRRPAASRHAGL